jgi:hypothetical protein
MRLPMTIPRHKTVKKSKNITRTVEHSFEFHRSDLLKLLRLPPDAVLTLVSSAGSTVIDGTDAVLFAKATETR